MDTRLVLHLLSHVLVENLNILGKNSGRMLLISVQEALVDNRLVVLDQLNNVAEHLKLSVDSRMLRHHLGIVERNIVSLKNSNSYLLL